MTRFLQGRLAAAACGTLACLAVYALLALLLPDLRRILEDRAGDLALSLAAEQAPAAPAMPVVVVDIDAASIEAYGPWPWRRTLVADLVARAADSGAAAIGVDILFAEPDSRSPAALARRLGEVSGDPAIVALTGRLEDDDARLAQALAGRPVALGFALVPAGRDTVGGDTVGGAPVLIRGPTVLPGLWRFPGAEAPAEVLATVAAGAGCLALPGDGDGVVRRLPLFVGVGEDIRPGLALETVRLARGATLFRIDTQSGRFAVGQIAGALGDDAMLRLVPPAATPPILRLPARDLLGAAGPVPALAGAVVFIGGSAPELGGLRATAGEPLTPSVMIQAAAARQILQGFIPHPPSLLQSLGYPVAGLAGLAGVVVPVALPPLLGGLVMVIGIAVLAVLAVYLAASGVLIEPGLPLLLMVTGYVVTAVLAFAVQQRRARHIRRRFEQHLSPRVVDLIARNPSLLKLQGQRREVTSLFTDIAGFTGITHRADPEVLLAMLDDYFEGMCAIITAHGGMIDKFVGDAIHAFFNAPLDQPGHAEAAVRCALALGAWSEEYRRRDIPAALGFGLTRIGVETGVAIVGDVGIRSKLDYTAYGDAVNTAARLEAANKDLGTTICVGPGTAARCPPGLLRPGPRVALRGFDEPVPTFQPVPQGTAAT